MNLPYHKLQFLLKTHLRYVLNKVYLNKKGSAINNWSSMFVFIFSIGQFITKSTVSHFDFTVFITPNHFNGKCCNRCKGKKAEWKSNFSN